MKREGIPFEAIPAAGVHGVGLRAMPGNVLKLARGLAASRRVLRRFRPDVLLFTGGYVAVPMGLAARLPGLGFRRPKSVLYVPDIEPGLALKTLARLADHIAVSAEESRAYFSRRTPLAVTGYPVRASLKAWDAAEARRVMGLNPLPTSPISKTEMGEGQALPTLLVWGGSKGARSINRAVLAALPELLEEMEIIHVSGETDWPEVEAARAALLAPRPSGSGLRSSPLASRYHPYPYLHEEMGAAFTAADLVVSRAGASSLGEYPLFGLPAILVPYPYAWRYQRVNAAHLEQRGGAIVIENADLPEKLLPAIRALMQDGERRQQMRQAMRTQARPQAAQAIADVLRSLASDQAEAINHG